MTLAIAVAGVGTVDGVFSREWDLLAVFAILDMLLVALGLRVFGRRRAVRLCSDLVGWPLRRSAATGEPFESVADRAVASYRDRLDPQVGGQGPT